MNKTELMEMLDREYDNLCEKAYRKGKPMHPNSNDRKMADALYLALGCLKGDLSKETMALAFRDMDEAYDRSMKEFSKQYKGE